MALIKPFADQLGYWIRMRLSFKPNVTYRFQHCLEWVMRVYTSKRTPDSVVTYLFHDCERSLWLFCLVYIARACDDQSTVHRDWQLGGYQFCAIFEGLTEFCFVFRFGFRASLLDFTSQIERLRVSYYCVDVQRVLAHFIANTVAHVHRQAGKVRSSTACVFRSFHDAPQRPLSGFGGAASRRGGEWEGKNGKGREERRGRGRQGRGGEGPLRLTIPGSLFTLVRPWAFICKRFVCVCYVHTGTATTTEPPEPDCDVGPPANRVNCGFPGIQAQACYERGCCFDSSIPGVPWCFHGKDSISTFILT